MAAGGHAAAGLKRIGGHPALDFVNTIDWRGRAAAKDYLASPAALVAWATGAGLPGTRAAAARPSAALFKSAIALREAGHRLFRAAAAGKPGPAADLALVNRLLRRAAARRALVPRGLGYVWLRAAPHEPLGPLLAMLAAATAELLASPALARVRLCAGPGCGWLFLDESPNRSRRWCAMESCGNRAKGRRHYARRRAGAAA